MAVPYNASETFSMGRTSGVLDQFFSSFTNLSYKPGETVIRAGDPPSGVYYLTRGLVRQFTISTTGDTFIVHVYRPGSFFPLMWALSDIPNTFYFETMTACTLIRAPREAVVKFLLAHPTVLLDTTKRLLTGLHGFITRTGSLVMDDAYTKIVLLLLYYAKKFGEPTDKGIRIPMPLVHREMAAWIGTTRETASLQIEKLIQRGVVKHYGRKIVISNIADLEKELSLAKSTPVKA